MKKLIGFPLGFILIPQALLLAFTRFAALLRGQPLSGDALDALVIVSGVCVAMMTVISACWLFGFPDGDGAIDDWREDQRRIVAKREAEISALDAAIGIPRIPVRR